MKKKDLIFFGMFGFLSMTLALVVFEAGLRIFSVVPTVDKQYSAFRVDSEISYGHSPNTVSAGTAPYDEFVYEYRHNSQGFRDIEHPEKKEPGTFRILGLGDSFTYGAGAQFEDTYLAVVERELNNNNLNKRVEIIKAGISRSFPEHQRLVLKKYGPYYRPDLVIVGFTPNDIVDTHLSLNSIQVRPDGRLQIGSREPSVINDFLYRNSHVWRFIRFTIFRFSQRLHWKLMYDVEENKDAWKRILADYDDMAKLSRDLGAQMMIVVIPQSRSWLKGQEKIEKHLENWANANGVLFVPTHHRFQAAPEPPEALHYPKDGHCTPLGYRMIAEEILIKLRSTYFRN